MRQVSRFLDELMQGASKKQIDRGLALPTAVPINHGKRPPGGRLFFQTQLLESVLPDSLPGHGADNAILANTLALQQKFRTARGHAGIEGHQPAHQGGDPRRAGRGLFERQDHRGCGPARQRRAAAAAEFLGEARQGNGVLAAAEPHLLPGARARWCANGTPISSSTIPARTASKPSCASSKANRPILELTLDYRTERNNVWGVTARNREQNLALNLLMDPEIDFVTMLGPAGTGKTLLTLAAGLAQTLDHNRFSEIIMTRVTIPLGEDIGFLPGTEEEKMEPWMGALMDNLEVLTQGQPGGTWGRGATNDLLRHRIKIRSLNFMRGRTFLNRFIIIDEAQNLTPKQMKALVTRAGPGTKMVCLGNIAQIDTPYLTETTSGLTYVVNRFHGWAFSGHITLVRGERSRLADYASEVL